MMAVVDGRQAQSRGMNQQEMAELMLSLGAHYALNLDLWRVPTMVVRPLVKLRQGLSTAHQSAQRLIPNAVGIFQRLR